jgi:predicted nucleotidyltransferase
MNKNDVNFDRYKKTLTTIIHKHLPTCTIYLFGSRARKTEHSGSDIDIALDCNAPISKNSIFKIYDDLEETTIPLTVDLVDLYSASDTLKNEVKKEGIVWEQ